MPERTISRTKLAVGYAGFGLFAVFFFFYATFPFEAAKTRLQREAAAQGYEVEIGGLGMGLGGVTASDLLVRKKGPPPAEGSGPDTLLIDSLSVRPSLFPLGAAFSADAFGGDISGAVGGISELTVRLHLDDVDLSQGNIKGFTGLNLAGIVNGKVDLRAPLKPIVGRTDGAKEADFGAADGTISLTGAEITLNGGSINIPSMGGDTDLPKVILGELKAKMKVDKGTGTLESLVAKSTDVHVMGDGTVKLAKNLPYSAPNLALRLKVEEDLKKRLGPLSMGISILPADDKDPQFRKATLVGYFSALQVKELQGRMMR